MLTTTIKGKTAKAAAGLAAAALVAGSSLFGGSTAGADPKQATALVGVGSDTTQDVMDALAGEANGTLYTAIRSSAASGNKQITSWDAIYPGSTACISPKAPGASFDRPNGSGAGVLALSRASDGANFTTTAACGGVAKSLSGLVDFARSSSGPSAGTGLTYLPYARDGVGYGYYATSGVTTPVTSLTVAQLTQLFSTAGPQLINGVNVYACGIQTSSGTYKFWRKAVSGDNATSENTATGTCNTAGTGSRLEENDGAGLKAKGDAISAANSGAPVQVVVGFSAAKFISMSNGVSASTLAGSGADLGIISDVDAAKPYSGTAPNLTPNPGFYASTTFGRDIYNVFPTGKVTGLASTNVDIKSLFVGATSAICSGPAQTIVNKFGFLSLTSGCGSTALVGALAP